MSTRTIITRTATFAGTIATRRWAIALVLVAVIAVFGLMLAQPHSPIVSLDQPTASLSGGAPMTHLTGSVYDGRAYGRQAASVASWSPGGHPTGSVHDGRAYGQAATTRSTGAPMSHLTGSVYEPR